MKRRFIAVLLAAVLTVSGSMPVLAAETGEGIMENETGDAAGDEAIMPETNGETETVIETMEEEAVDIQEEDAAEEEHFEEPVELAENDEVAAAETFSEVDKNGLKWEVTDGVLTISGNGVIERNESLLTRNLLGDMCNKTIFSINIEEGIVGIGERAFREFYGLTSVNIPGSVEEIGYEAFYDCTKLKKLTIPEGVKRIGERAFDTCCSLTNVTISDSVTEIGDGVFKWCIALTSVVISNSVTEIGDHTFSRCGALTSINMPDSVTKIGVGAFSGCESLPSIRIPDGVTEIEDWAFAGCEKLTEVTIPNAITKIGKEAFRGCGMSEISLPESVTEIGHLAFYGCKNLTSVFIPRGVAKINSWAFRNCESLVDTKIANGVTEIAYGAFAGCKNLSEVTIPKSVKSVGYAAFSGCKGLQSVTFKGDAPEISNEASETEGAIVGDIALDVNDKGVEPFCDVTATAFYPAGNQTYTEEIRTAYGSGLTWEEQKKPDLPFTDVSQEDWYLDAAGYVFSRGIMTGMNETEFGPSVKLSRAQFATILYRMEGEPEAAYDAAAFPDVKEGQFYTVPAMWAKGSSVIKGYEDGRFGPADEITREDMALMMYRYANMLGLDTSARGDISGFPDAEKISGYAAEAMKWAVGEELIRGKEEAGKDNIIEPQGTAERAQCATIIMRFMEGYGL